MNIAPRPKTPVEAFVDEILPENSSVLLRLPAGVSPERFKNAFQIAVMLQPKLLRCEPRIVFREVSRVANYGLSLDPSMGEAWLIIRKNKQGHDEPQAQLGYRGKMKLARQSGEVARLVAYPVSERCLAEGKFKVTLQSLVYEPDPFGDDSPPVGYFAYVLFKDGTEDFETMSIREIHKIRDRSDGYKAFKNKRIASTPWSDYEGEMCKKTVLSRLLKRVPMSADLVQFLREDEAADYTEVEEVDAALPPERRQRVGRLETLRKIAAPTPKRKNADINVSDSEHELGTDDEQDEPAPSETVDAPDTPDTSADDDGDAIDRKSQDYKTGAADFAEGLKRCLHADIRAEPQRFENWKAGWQEAKEADEETNAREDT